jgi:2-phospho-L-lactate guanylyltransferase (CobY/MobA/RfbA family)
MKVEALEELYIALASFSVYLSEFVIPEGDWPLLSPHAVKHRIAAVNNALFIVAPCTFSK